MAKVTNPLLSGDASGDFGKKIVFRKGGTVTRYHKPRNPRSPAQVAHRQAFKEYYMSALTQAAADLLYAALAHLHDDRYSLIDHEHDHGGLNGLGDDDHLQYFNQTRGDARYLLSGQSDPLTQYYNQTRGDARYALIARGVANGGNHAHTGNNDGAVIAYSSLSGTPTPDTIETKTDSTARTYTANTFYDIGSAVTCPPSTLLYAVHIALQYDGDAWHTYTGAVIAAPGTWKAGGVQIAYTSPFEGHNGNDLTVSFRFKLGQTSRIMQVAFSANLTVASGGFVRVTARKLF